VSGAIVCLGPPWVPPRGPDHSPRPRLRDWPRAPRRHDWPRVGQVQMKQRGAFNQGSDRARRAQ